MRDRVTSRGAAMAWLRRLISASDRGATVVEYALGIGLICVVSLGAISFLQDESEDGFQERSGRVGAPDLEAGLPGGTTGGTSGGGSTTGGGGTPNAAPAILTAQAPTQSGDKTGNNWDATVTLTMLGDGSPTTGIRITGTWTLFVEGVARPADPPVSCVTGVNGECVFTRDDMEHRTNQAEVTKAVFTVSGYTYTLSDPMQSYTIPPAPAQTIEVPRPS